MIQDNTAKWKIRKFTNFEVAKSALPLGHLYFSLEKTVPVGSIPALGGLYSRALYADLFAYAQEKGLVISENEWQSIASNNGKCEYYSSGDGSTTFRVPKIPNTIVGDVPSEVPVVGNGMTLGLTNGIGNFGLTVGAVAGSGNYYLGNDGGSYGKSVGNTTGAYTTPTVNDYRGGITTDPTKSGIVAKMSSTKTTGQWLIVAFGTISNVGNADVANVMQAVEQVQIGLGATDNKITGISDYIIESYRNGTEWYEVYKSGKVRQGGELMATQGDTWYTITLLKKMANSNYSITCGIITTQGTWGAQSSPTFRAKTTTSFIYGATGNTTEWGVMWIAEGQGA